MCKDNCCNQWQIFIDKSTYDKYSSLEDDTRKKIYKNIQVISEAPFSALITKSENGRCSFLDENGLCIIHANLGAEYLGDICKWYPRKICDTGGELEAYLEVSCEAAADLILFDQDIITLESGELESEQPIPPARVLEPHKYTSAYNAGDVFQLLRTISLIILQNRQHCLNLRLFILGLFIKQMSGLLKVCPEGSDREIVKQAAAFVGKLESGIYNELDKQVVGGIDLRIDFIIGMIKTLEEKNNPGMNLCINQACEGFGLTLDGVLPGGIQELSIKGYEMYFADKEYIFENHLINHLLSEGFPFNHRYRDNIMKNYQELLVKYSLVKFLLVGISMYKKRFDRWGIVECVSMFSRLFDHNTLGALVMK